VSGLCPEPLESPGEGREGRRIDGGRDVASRLIKHGPPEIYDRSPPLL